MKKLAALTVLVLAATVPALAEPSSTVRAAEPVPTQATPEGEHVVIAVVDTGINPYHRFFSAPALDAHPSTYIDGFPEYARTTELTLDAPSIEAAREADASIWTNLHVSRPSAAFDPIDGRLYTFPGTRVIGAISFGEYVDDPNTLRIWDDHGHGTHSAGLALGANMAAPDGNVLIVMVEASAGTFVPAIRWAARQPWIDALSLSLGSIANAPSAAELRRAEEAALVATHDAALQGKPVFIASGNGVSNTGLAPDRCTTYTSGFTGPTWVTRVGAAHRTTGNPTWWHCVPVEVIGKTNISSPNTNTLSRWGNAGGTSAATPNVAGHFAHLLLRARREGSPLSRLDLTERLIRSAAPAPPAPSVGGWPVPYPASIAEQGYGLVDDAALARVSLDGVPPARPDAADWFRIDHDLRALLWCRQLAVPCSG